MSVEEDTEGLAVTSSAAPWDTAALPTFRGANASATSNNATPPPVENAEGNEGQQQQHQQQLQASSQHPHPPPLQRRLQPDRRKDALEDVLHAHKQRRLQMLDGGAADFRHVSQRRRASDYAGLAPSSRSSKHLLAVADAQLYKKRAGRSPSKTKKGTAARAALSLSSSTLSSPQKADTPNALGKRRRKSKSHRSKKKRKSSSRASPSPSPPARDPIQRSSPSLPSPRISHSAEGSTHNVHTEQPPPMIELVATATSRRDSFLVQLHTPEVLPPSTPQKESTEESLAQSLPQQQQQQQHHLLSSLLSPVNTEKPPQTPDNVAEPYLAQPLRPTMCAGVDNVSAEQRKLPAFRRINSRVSLAASVNTELTSSATAWKGRGKGKSTGGAAQGDSGDSNESSSRRRSMRRASSIKTLSIVWVQRPSKPASASQRALLRRQQQKIERDRTDAVTKWRAQPPSPPSQQQQQQQPTRKKSGASQQLRSPAKNRFPVSGQHAGGAHASPGQVAQRSNSGVETNLDASSEPPDAIEENNGSGSHDAHCVDGARSRSEASQRTQASDKTSRNEGKRSSVVRRRSEKPATTDEGLPLLRNSAGHPLSALPTTPAGFAAPLKPAYSRSDETGGAGSRRQSRKPNRASSLRTGADHGSGDEAQSPLQNGNGSVKVLPELFYADSASRRVAPHRHSEAQPSADDALSHTLDAILARHGASTNGATIRSSNLSSMPTRSATAAPHHPALSVVSNGPAESTMEIRRCCTEVNGTAEDASTSADKDEQRFLPPITVHTYDKAGKATHTSRLRSSRVSPAAAAPAASVRAEATEVRKFAPLVVEQRRSLFVSSQQVPSQPQGGVRDGLGPSTSATALSGAVSTKVKKTKNSGADASSSGAVARGSSVPSAWTEGEGQQIPSGYPSVRLPAVSLPHPRPSPENGEQKKETEKAKDDGLEPATEPAVALKQRLSRGPSRPPRRNGSRKKVVEPKGGAYAFAPYMAGMPTVAGGRARYLPSLAYHPHTTATNARAAQKPRRLKKAKNVEQIERVARPKPIDYAALTTQSDPLDYLLGRHGFWGESTTR